MMLSVVQVKATCLKDDVPVIKYMDVRSMLRCAFLPTWRVDERMGHR
jgi:hypothetical protein